MTEKNKSEKMTNASKPVPMKLFAAWEVDRTPSNCIPRLCTLRITRLRVCGALGETGGGAASGAGAGAVILAARMHSSKRTLRSNDIAVPPLDVELDLCFSLQYPHFVKRDGNRLQIMLQRRKKYKNRTILGYKILAEGVIRMDQVESSKTSGAGVEDLHVPALWYYQHLCFLHEKTNPTSEIVDNLETTTNNTSIEEPVTKKEKSSIKRQNAIFKKQEELLESAKQLVNANSSSELTSADAFGHSVGSQLKELQKMQRLICEKLIGELLFYAKLGELTLDTSISINPHHYFTQPHNRPVLQCQLRTPQQSVSSMQPSPYQLSPSPQHSHPSQYRPSPSLSPQHSHPSQYRPSPSPSPSPQHSHPSQYRPSPSPQHSHPSQYRPSPSPSPQHSHPSQYRPSPSPSPQHSHPSQYQPSPSPSPQHSHQSQYQPSPSPSPQHSHPSQYQPSPSPHISRSLPFQSSLTSAHTHPPPPQTPTDELLVYSIDVQSTQSQPSSIIDLLNTSVNPSNIPSEMSQQKVFRGKGTDIHDIHDI